jgi:[acyl-carrier-protein] S-malonyltransferase
MIISVVPAVNGRCATWRTPSLRENCNRPVKSSPTRESCSAALLDGDDEDVITMELRSGEPVASKRGDGCRVRKLGRKATRRVRSSMEIDDRPALRGTDQRPSAPMNGSVARAARRRQLAFVFPGLASAQAGMGQLWADHWAWARVADASRASGLDVESLLLDADPRSLRHLTNADVALLTLARMAVDALADAGVTATACAGYSGGEYSALMASGALSFDDAIRLVRERGDALQAVADGASGTMASVGGVTHDEADAICRLVGGPVWVANYNAPGNVTISGTEQAVADAAVVAADFGARKVVPLGLPGAFHTPLMEDGRGRLDAALMATRFAMAAVPVVTNVDGRAHLRAREWPRLLSAEVCAPVRWQQTIEHLAHDGVCTFIEIGPGGVLSGFVRQTLPYASVLTVSTPADIEAALDALDDENGCAHVDYSVGERLEVSERLVVSPASGPFFPAEPTIVTTEGEILTAGAVLGSVGDTKVRSPFSGWLMGLLVVPGERVSRGQPVAWLRSMQAGL